MKYFCSLPSIRHIQSHHDFISEVDSILIHSSAATLSINERHVRSDLCLIGRVSVLFWADGRTSAFLSFSRLLSRQLNWIYKRKEALFVLVSIWHEYTTGCRVYLWVMWSVTLLQRSRSPVARRQRRQKDVVFLPCSTYCGVYVEYGVYEQVLVAVAAASWGHQILRLPLMSELCLSWCEPRRAPRYFLTVLLPLIPAKYPFLQHIFHSIHVPRIHFRARTTCASGDIWRKLLHSSGAVIDLSVDCFLDLVW